MSEHRAMTATNLFHVNTPMAPHGLSDPTTEVLDSVRHSPAEKDQLTFWYFG